MSLAGDHNHIAPALRGAIHVPGVYRLRCADVRPMLLGKRNMRLDAALTGEQPALRLVQGLKASQEGMLNGMQGQQLQPSERHPLEPLCNRRMKMGSGPMLMRGKRPGGAQHLSALGRTDSAHANASVVAARPGSRAEDGSPESGG